MRRQALHIYEFGPFRLDVIERLLMRDDAVVPLTPKVFDTLLVLVEHGGHVLRKDELMRLLWPDSFVEESSLAQNISLLRKALGDGAPGRQYIETVPKLGYRFVPEVREVREGTGVNGESGEATPPPPAVVGDGFKDEVERHAAEFPPAAPGESRQERGKIWRRLARHPALAACALLAAVAVGVYVWRARVRNEAEGATALRSVAVLPFRTMGGEGESEMLGLGMADALIIRLSGLERPAVLPTSSVIKYAGREGDALSAGRELGVDAVLDGTVQRAGTRVRVTAHLIRLGDGKTLWAGTFDRPYDDIFALQDSISEQLTESLVPRLAGGAGRAPARQLTKSTEAYELYLLGLNFWNRRTVDGLTKAINHLQEAVAKDPDFALAHAILADCYYLNAIRRYNIIPTEESVVRARAAAERALELDEAIAEAHAVMAGVKTFELNYEAAAREYERALELNPNSATARVRFGHFLFSLCRPEDALHEMRRARALDPLSPTTNGALSYMLLMSRDYGEALKYARRAHEIEPDAFEHMTTLGEAYVANGMYDEAVAVFSKQADKNASLSRQFVIYAYAAAGRHEEARSLLAEFLRTPGFEPTPRYNFVIIYGLLGGKDRAFEYMEQVYPNPYNLAMLKFDPQLDTLRSDPRFEATLRFLEQRARSDAPHAIRNQ